MSDLPEWVGFRPTSLHVKSCSGYSDDMSVPLVRKHTVSAFPASKTAPGPEIFPFEQDIFLHKHKILYFDEEVAELTNNQERLRSGFSTANQINFDLQLSDLQSFS